MEEVLRMNAISKMHGVAGRLALLAIAVAFTGVLRETQAEIPPYTPPAVVPKTGIGLWGDGTGVFPASRPPVRWNEATGENIKWKVAMPNFSASAPVAVGNRVLCWSEWSWKTRFPVLHCYDAESGTEVWTAEIDAVAALPGLSEEERKALRQDLTFCHERTHAAFRLPNLFLMGGGEKKAATSPEFLQSVVQDLQKGGYQVPDPDVLLMGSRAFKHLKLRPEIDRKHRGAIARLAKHGLRHRIKTCACGCSAYLGVAMPTPVSDGRRVYVMTALGTVACLDMNDGKVIWSRMATGLKKTATDWLYCSPRLYGDVLLTCFGGLLWNGNRLIAWDRRNGKKLWDRPSKPRKRWGEGTNGGNMAILQLPDSEDPTAPLTAVVLTPQGRVVRIADGKVYPLTLPAVSIYSGWGTNPDRPGFLCTNQARPNSWNARLLSLKGQDVLQKALWKHKGEVFSGRPVCWKDRIYCSKFQYDAQGNFLGGKTKPKTEQNVGCNAPATNGTILVGAEHVYGIVARRGTSMYDWGWGNAACEVFTLDGKLAARNTLSPLPLKGERLQRMMSQIPKYTRKKPYENFSVSCPMTIAGDRLFIRSNDYLYCIASTKK